VAIEKWGENGHAGHLSDVTNGNGRVKTAGLTVPKAPHLPAPPEDDWGHGTLLGANPGDVWDIPAEPLKAAHFATFPSELPRRAILSSCPARVCAECGAPWRPRYTEPALVGVRGLPRAASNRVGDYAYGGEGLVGTGFGVRRAVGFAPPSCGHGEAWRPGVVLDPFAGAGTTLLAAAREGRDWIGIELNPKYVAEIIRPRLAAFAAPLDSFPTAGRREQTPSVVQAPDGRVVDA
jgi:hypothetical protein